MTSTHSCPKCGSQRHLQVAWNDQRSVPYGPGDPRTFDVMLAVHSCSACHHTWMDAKAEALLAEALAGP